MDLSRPISTVVPSLDGPVLTVLTRTTQPMTGRQVHRLAGVGSVTGVRKVLHRLVATGLVDATDIGASTAYALNRDHIAAPAVRDLASLREVLIARLADAIGEWPLPPLHASLFGSAARGDGDLDSDIDLLVVTTDDHSTGEPFDDPLAALAVNVRRWTGNHAQFYELSPERFRRHLDVNEPIVDEWLRDSITLYGPDIRHLRNRFIHRRYS